MGFDIQGERRCSGASAPELLGSFENKEQKMRDVIFKSTSFHC